MVRDALVEELVEHLRAQNSGRRATATDRWYERSYPYLVQDTRITKASLVRAMAAAGSWVNVIPTASPGEDSRAIAALAQSLKNLERASPRNRDRARKAVVEAARNAFGLEGDSERIVVLSKALHFLRPKLVPMIDTNVARAWKSLVRKKAFHWLGARFKTKSLIAPGHKRPMKADFIKYWEIADQLSGNGKRLSYRELDELLFRYAARPRKSAIPKSESA
jgi:hypothetical protein